MSLLIVTVDSPAAQAQAQALASALRQHGSPVAAIVPCHILVREAVRLAPQAVVALDPGDGPALLDALRLLAGSVQVPVLLLGPSQAPAESADPADTPQSDPWLAAQVMAWWPLLPDDAAAAACVVQAGLRLALPRFALQRQQAAALADALARLDERKWIDRAKGLLMSQLHLPEPEAFALLRTASMQANLRVGEVSRGVIEAAQSALAVNLAGQLRMLSQRVVRCLGLLAAAPARSRGDEGLADTLQHLQRNLGRLSALALLDQAAEELQACAQAWTALQAQALATAALAARGGPDLAASLALADSRAETLLAAADRLTTRLAHLSGRPLLRVVNLCGRQRMLSQRLAKQALLAGQLADAAAAAQAAAAADTVREFEATLLTLEQAPLSSDDIRAALAQARGQWQRLLDGLRRAGGTDAAAGRGALARESDALLAGFDQLTTLYEHSLQVLMG